MKASKKNSQATEVKNNAMEQPQTERQSLRSLCKKLREEYGSDERINNLLCIYYKKLHNLSILKTREQWEREGFKVMNTVENRFPAWGKPFRSVIMSWATLTALCSFIFSSSTSGREV